MANFIKHTSCDECGSSDAKAIYSDGSSFCWSCNFTVPSEEYRLNNPSKPSKIKVSIKHQTKDHMEKNEKLKEIVTTEQTAELKSRTTSKGNGYRGIRDDVYQTFGVRVEYDDDEEVSAVYYPCTEQGELTGWKPRVHPKQFGGSIGRTGVSCDMFGQFKYKQDAKVCLIVGGEHDALAAYQMLKDYYKTKNWDFEPVVVSPTVGETGSAKQIAKNYAWFDKYSKIVLGYDADEPGMEAMEKAVNALPKGKVFIANWSMKDPNDMLQKGKDRQFISDFYSAKAYVPAGVLASTDIYQKMLDQSSQEKITLPPVFGKLNDMLGGGLTLGHAYTCSGVTGGGKTSLVNEMIYHWIFNSPYTVGVVSLELNASQYGEVLLSRHVQQKLAKLNSEDKVKFLQSEKIKASGKELFEREDGSPRFMLVEDRDSSFEQFQAVVEQMVISSGVRLIVVDPWTDIGIDGLTIDEQAVAMKWIKSMIKSHNCTFFLINHVRKGQSGQKDQSSGGMISESDIMGSSSVMKSASANILLVRNKLAEDLVERNSTSIYLSKNRLMSETGPAGKIYYDSQTHTLHDLDTWLDENSPN
ncbi:putative DNA primase/helicase [Curvibacter phage P26059A]|nr:putative DNA primase/helicase [Curvibacter phage P26059A]